MTAGMAAASPAAVATSASEIPGATTARLAEPLWPIPLKEFMIPHTVPNKPMNGVVFPVVAKKGTICVSRVISVFIARRNDRFTLPIPLNLVLKEEFSLFSSDDCGWDVSPD